MIVSIIDIGSNSIKLLVAQKNNQAIEPIYESSQDTRISSKSSVEENLLNERCMLSAVESVQSLLKESSVYAPDRTLITATSAVRDAKNKDAFAEHIKAATGHTLKILSGDEEAKGIALGIKTDPKLSNIGDFCLFDIGGGSLELISFQNDQLTQAISLPLGAVRVTQQFAGDGTEPWSTDLQEQVAQYVLKTVNESSFNWPQDVQLVATGGAVNVACNILALQNKSNDNTLSYPSIKALQAQLCQMTIAERLQVPGLPTKRADIAPAALTTIATLMELGKHKSLTQSFHNLRYGLAKELLDV